MTLIESFASGMLPKYGVPSIALYNRAGICIGHYVDPQAFHEHVTIQ